MLGGGSLVIAYPVLIALRKAYPGVKFIFVTTPSIKMFAESLKVFDEIIIIKDATLLDVLTSSLAALRRLWRVDTFVDMEVYSKLSAIFSLLTNARNRIGFYMDFVFWRKHIFNYLIYFNRYAGIYLEYEHIAHLFGVNIVPDDDCRKYFCDGLSLKVRGLGPKETKKIGIGHACSSLSPERMLSADQWRQVFLKRLPETAVECCFLGGVNDRKAADNIISLLGKEFPRVRWVNYCGELTLEGSIRTLNGIDEFWGVDSGLLHYARLMGVPSLSFWGPTDPATRLRPFSYLREEVVYKKISCSPCAHIIDQAPCLDNNICIRNLFQEKKIENPPWITTGGSFNTPD
jgi:ADP-heptose:LPS heptosyltransferase